jgi:hypothetical protein
LEEVLEELLYHIQAGPDSDTGEQEVETSEPDHQAAD